MEVYHVLELARLLAHLEDRSLDRPCFQQSIKTDGGGRPLDQRGQNRCPVCLLDEPLPHADSVNGLARGHRPERVFHSLPEVLEPVVHLDLVSRRREVDDARLELHDEGRLLAAVVVRVRTGPEAVAPAAQRRRHAVRDV